MIYTHSVGRALQYFPEHIALLRDGQAVTFLELDIRVRKIAAALRRRGFLSGERLAFLMPNGPDYIELVYACSLLGVIAVPINTRYAGAEIDRLRPVISLGREHGESGMGTRDRPRSS